MKRILSGRALVVEDNVIIAFEAEEQLGDLGAEAVDLAGNVALALDLIRDHAYEFALLDINLGAETSERVAEALLARGTPFVFSTGYGEVPWASPEMARAPIVTKPFDAAALERAVAIALPAAASNG